MYNYQTFARQTKLKQKQSQIRKHNIENNKRNQKKIPQMIQSHKKRIQGFILAMVEKPIIIQQYRSTNYQPRSFHRQNQLPKNNNKDKARAQSNMNKNTYLDVVPFKNASNHKFRQTQCEQDLQPFKYTAFNSALRIKESLQKSRVNYLDLYPKIKTQIEGKIKPNNMTNTSLSKMINKSIFRQLHQKTHFNSLKSIYSLSPCGFPTQIEGKENNLTTTNYFQGEQDISVRRTLSKILHDNHHRFENSKEALIKCGFLKNNNHPNPKIQKYNSTSKSTSIK